jgi:hypothetical protein
LPTGNNGSGWVHWPFVRSFRPTARDNPTVKIHSRNGPQNELPLELDVGDLNPGATVGASVQTKWWAAPQRMAPSFKLVNSFAYWANNLFYRECAGSIEV